ncbi:MAG: DMT family transporter [bacterium]|nr:DMT family transporter [bacterium]
MKFYQDWRFYTGLSIICWGFWGFFSKMTVNRLDWQTVFLFFGLSTLLVASITSPEAYNNLFNRSAWIGITAGLTGALGFRFFYQALEKGPATVIIPVSAMYILVAVLLTVIFLQEPFTMRKFFGILSAIAAIFLLS